MGFAWMLSGVFLLRVNKHRISISPWKGTVVILSLGLTLLDNILKPGMLPEPLLTSLLIISRNSYYLVGPTLWFYTITVLNRKNLNKTDLLHLLPFIFMCIILSFNLDILLPAINPPPRDGVALKVLLDPEFYRVRLSIISRGIYCFMVYKLIRNHMREVPEFYSRKTFVNTLSWLYYLVIIYLIFFVLNFIITLLSPEIGLLLSSFISITRVLPSLLFIFFFTIFAQNQPVPEDKQLLEEKTGTDTVKYKTSALSSNESNSLFEKLNRYITKEELYKEPDLTLNWLAESLDETRHHVSEVINRETGENFYTFINGFRYEEFLNCLKEDRYPNLTISAIAMECGFKSNSVFYSIFKKRTGMTPVQYKKQLSA